MVPSEMESDLLALPTPLANPQGQNAPAIAHGRSARSLAVPRFQPALPDVRRVAETNDDRDHETDDPWPELPEWALPQASHEDLMLLLREEERRCRLKAEQTGSSWSVPPS